MPVPKDVVDAAVRAARARGQDVGDVPVAAIAREAGVSRSTLLRRLGGTRAALDDAVRAAGVDPGGRAPVRIRALAAAASLLQEEGLASTTMEAIAAHADCAVESLYAAYGTRDELLAATFERYSPLTDIERFFDAPPADLRTTVTAFYRTIGAALIRPPRVVPALLAEILSRPESPTARAIYERGAPRLLAALGGWLATEVRAGRIRELPVPLLIQQLLAPFVAHAALRPILEGIGIALPDPDLASVIFADNFLRAVATSGSSPSGRPPRNAT
ncbi:MAG: TetR/AcrR family transcriptional regulator [Tetrasphaera sp.]